MANLQHELVNHQNQTQLSKETGMPSPVNNTITTPPSTNKSTYFHNSGERSFQFYSGNNPYDAMITVSGHRHYFSDEICFTTA